MNSWRTGLTAFRVVAMGQMISLLGDEVNNFSITIWAFEKTGSATSLALIGFFHLLPLVIVSPFAGVIVDRSNRKLMLMLSDLGGVAVAVVTLGLQLFGVLQLWHIYAGLVVNGITQAFQGPAYASALSLMISKEEYPKASGALSLADSVRTLAGPLIAVILYPVLGLTGVFLLDVLSYIGPLTALAFIRIPQPPPPETRTRIKWLEEASFGFKYLWSHSSLLGLLLTSAAFNFAFGAAQAIQPALILARGGEAALAVVRTAAGIGGILGGLAVSAWGVPKRRILGGLLGMGLYAAGLVVMGLGQHIWLWGLASALSMSVYTLIGASNGAIWQAKIAPAFQGRVRAARQSVSFIASPLGMLVMGPITDRLLTPGMKDGGGLTTVFAGLVGTGAGAGVALAVLFTGVWGLGVVASAALNPKVRDVERIVPDFDAMNVADAA